MSGQEFIFMGVVVGLVIGIICGAIPLYMGATKNQRRLGIAAFISCTVSGGILGLWLALPVSVVFVWLINNANKKINSNG